MARPDEIELQQQQAAQGLPISTLSPLRSQPVQQLSLAPAPAPVQQQPQVVDRVLYNQQQRQAQQEAEQSRALEEARQRDALMRRYEMMQQAAAQIRAARAEDDGGGFFDRVRGAYNAIPGPARRFIPGAREIEGLTQNIPGTDTSLYDIGRTDIPRPVRDVAVKGVAEGFRVVPGVGALASAADQANLLGVDVPTGQDIRRGVANLVVPRELWEVALEFAPGIGTVDDIMRAAKAGTPEALAAVRRAVASDAGQQILRKAGSEVGRLQVPGMAQPPQAVGTFLAPLKDFNEVEQSVVTGTGLAKQVLARSGISPGLIADNPLGRALLAYRTQLAAGEQLTNVAVQSALDAHARRFLGTDPLGMSAAGKILGKDWHDVFANPPANLGTAAKTYIADYKKLIDEVEDLRESVGLPVRRGAIQNYIPRKVLEIRDIKLRGKMKASLPRVYMAAAGEGAEQGVQAGIKYAGPRETMQDFIRNAYTEVANKQLSDALEAMGVKPSQLVPQPVRARMEAAVSARRQAETAVRQLRFNVAATRDIGKAQKHYQNLQQARQTLDVARGEFTSAKRAYSRAMEVARNKEVAKGHFWGPNQPLEIPIRMWNNRYYPREWVDGIEGALQDMVAPHRTQAVWSKGLEYLGNHVRFLSAVGDFAAPLTHGLPLFGRSPPRWAKAAAAHYAAWFDPTIQARYIRDNIDVFQEMAQHGTPVQDVEFFNALRLGQEELGGQLGDIMARTRPTRVLGQQTFGRFQSAYDTFLGMARAELTKAMRNGVPDAVERQRIVRNMTGGLDSRVLGVTASQRGGEATWMAFSPRLLRSTIALAAELRNPTKAGSREVWRSAAGLVSGVTALYIAAGLAMDKTQEEIEEGLNPLAGKRFLAYKINDDWVGVGGQIRALVQLMAQSVADPQSLLKKDRFDNPLLNFYGTRGAPAINIAQIGIEGVFGVDADPYRNIDGPLDMFQHLGTSMVPFVVQNKIEGQGLPALAASLLGGRTSHETVTESVDDLVTADRLQKADGGFYEHYRDLPPDLKGEFDKRHPEEVQRLRDYREEQGRATFDNLRQTTLAGMAELAPLAKTDPAEYRRQVGDLIMRQAAITQYELEQLDLPEREGDLALLDRYFDAVKPATNQTTQATDFDKRDVLEEQFRAGLTDAEKKRLDEMLVYSADPTYQQLKLAKRDLENGGYFERRDEAFAGFIKRIPATSPMRKIADQNWGSLDAFTQWVKADTRSRGLAPELYDRHPAYSAWSDYYGDANKEFLIANPVLDALAVEWGYQDRVHSAEAARLYTERTGLKPPIPAQ